MNEIDVAQEYEEYIKATLASPTKEDQFVIETYYGNKPYRRFLVELIDQNIKDNLFEEGFHREFYHLVLTALHKNILQLHQIYGPDVDYNLVINNFDLLSEIKINKFAKIDEESAVWIKNNISLKSFINMWRVPYDKTENDYTKINELNSLFADVIRMIGQILKKKNAEPPTTITPLRFHEFHDHIARLHLIASNTNDVYDHVIIDEPVEIENYTIDCPKDSLSLRLWAQKVKNCVASYNDKILRKTSHIIFVSVDGSPTYTLEVDYNMEKTLRIKYTEKIYRSTMSSEEKQKVETLVIEAVRLSNEKKHNEESDAK